MNVYYISPHFDDAVGSCGGKISFDVKNNKKVAIITVFSNVKEPFSNYAIKLHDYWNLLDPYYDRMNENINACAVLNVKNITLNYEDAVYRIFNGNHLYPQEGDIFKIINKHDVSLVDNIIKDIKKIVSKTSTLYFPLSVGNHVDHVLVYQSGVKMKQEGYNVVFYMDFYYDEVAPKECNQMKKNIFRLNHECIKMKVNAVGKYKSQINMLFGDESKVIEYYEKKLKGEEVYYE